MRCEETQCEETKDIVVQYGEKLATFESSGGEPYKTILTREEIAWRKKYGETDTFIHPPIHPYIQPSIYPFIHLSIHISI
jgi:hypothetical protein